MDTKTIIKNTKIRVYYRSRTVKDVVFSLLLPRRCFSADMTMVFLSRYYIRRCESDCLLFYGDRLDFSLDRSFVSRDSFLDVYRSPSCRLYCACRG